MKKFIYGLLLTGLLCQPAAAALSKSETDQYVNRAVAFIKTREYDQSLTVFKEGLAKDPDNAILNAGMGNNLAALNRYREAIPYLEKAARSDPADQTAHFGLAACYQALGRDEQAIEHLKKCLDLNPHNARASIWLAGCYVRLAKAAPEKAKAKEYLQSALMTLEEAGNLEGAMEVKKILSTLQN